MLLLLGQHSLDKGVVLSFWTTWHVLGTSRAFWLAVVLVSTTANTQRMQVLDATPLVSEDHYVRTVVVVVVVVVVMMHSLFRAFQLFAKMVASDWSTSLLAGTTVAVWKSASEKPGGPFVMITGLRLTPM